MRACVYVLKRGEGVTADDRRPSASFFQTLDMDFCEFGCKPSLVSAGQYSSVCRHQATFYKRLGAAKFGGDL